MESQGSGCLFISRVPGIKAKVYELVDMSGLEPDECVLIRLTGQMRVLLEAAPALLSAFKMAVTVKSVAESIQRAITQVE